MNHEAVQIADQLMMEFPDKPDGFVIMGSVRSGQGNSAKAMEYWEKCLEIDPNRPDVTYGMSWYELQRGEYEKAAALLRKTLDLDPSMPGVRHLLASTAIFQGNPTAAIAVLEQELEMFPKAIESRSLLGQAYQQLKEYELAKKSYEAVMQVQPDHKKACYGLVTVCTRLGQIDEAKRYRETFEKMKAEELQALIDETTSFDDLTAVRQKVAATHTDAGRLYANSGRLPQAEQHWLRAAALDPKDTRCRECLISMYSSHKREADAIKICEQLSEVDPKNGIHCLNRGFLHARLGQFTAAEKAFRETTALAPDRPEGYRALAQLCLQTSSGLGQAKMYAAKAVQLDPSAAAHALLGRTCERSGDLAGALSALQRAIELDPASAEYRRVYRELQQRK